MCHAEDVLNDGQWPSLQERRENGDDEFNPCDLEAGPELLRAGVIREEVLRYFEEH